MNKIIFNTKGQISQVFTFIMALMVIGLIVLMATKSMGGLLNDKCDVDLITFKDSLQDELSSNNDYGSMNEIRIQAPCNYNILCLVDATVIDGEYLDAFSVSNAVLNSDMQGSFIISNSINDMTKTNIFLTTLNGEKTIPVGFVSQVEITHSDNSPISAVKCVNSTAGYFKLRTEGLGRKTKIR